MHMMHYEEALLLLSQIVREYCDIEEDSLF